MFDKFKFAITTLLLAIGVIKAPIPPQVRSYPTPSTEITMVPTQTPVVITLGPTTKPSTSSISPWRVKSTNFDCTKQIQRMSLEEKILCADIEWNYRSWAACSDNAAQDRAWTDVINKYGVTKDQLTVLNGKIEKEAAYAEQKELLWRVMGPVRTNCLKSLGR